MGNYKHFGTWLRLTLETHGITQQKLADTAGVSKKNIQNWTQGTTLPNVPNLVFILKALERLTNTEQETFYLHASWAILKDS